MVGVGFTIPNEPGRAVPTGLVNIGVNAILILLSVIEHFGKLITFFDLMIV